MNFKNKFLLLLPWIAALIIGIYLISNTYLINRDGTVYIGQAQLFENKPIEVIKSLCLKEAESGASRNPDFNGDGETDLLWHNSSTGEYVISLMNGTSTISQALVPGGTNWNIDKLGDFNGDGKTDLLWHNSSTGEYVIRLMNGTSTISQALVPGGTNWNIDKLGDFNGDGKTDLLWHNSSTGEYRIRLMNGTTVISQVPVPGEFNWLIEDLGDFNSDGKTDLLWHNSSTGEYVIRLMNGTSAISQALVPNGPDRLIEKFGYPFLIFIIHKAVSLIGLTDGTHGWIISAQSTTLLCMLAALIPLYFISKSLVGREKTIYALVILAFLPHPMRLAVDVVRDWSYILFLSLSFAALIAAAKGRNWWLYGVSGFLAGLGYLIRVECAQIVIYALVWFTLCVIWPRYWMTRGKTIFSVLLLMTCFTASALPHMYIKQQYLPEQLRPLIEESKASESGPAVFTADIGKGLPISIMRVIGKVGANLFYYFSVFSFIGFYQRFVKGFKEITDMERMFVGSFVLLNIVMLVWVLCNLHYLEKRHCLPLSLLVLFYCPVGLKFISEKTGSFFKLKPIFLFYTLMAAGILFCLPRLLEPVRKENRGILEAASWLNQNTKMENIIAVADTRILFYAQRNGFSIGDRDLKEANFAVAKVSAKDVVPEWGEKMMWCWSNSQTKDSKLIVYRLR